MTCPYCNIWPEAVYCCFTRTTLFITMFTMIVVVCSMKYTFRLDWLMCERVTGHLCPYCNVWSSWAVYCCFTCVHFTELLRCWFLHELYSRNKKFLKLYGNGKNGVHRFETVRSILAPDQPFAHSIVSFLAKKAYT